MSYRADGRCGSQFGDASCDPALSQGCCSINGYCGSTDEYCSISQGCQGGCLNNSSNGSLSTKQVNGIIGGVLGFAALCAILTTLLCWRRRRRFSQSSDLFLPQATGRSPITVNNYYFPIGAGVGSWLRNLGRGRSPLGGGIGIGPQYGFPNSPGYVESEVMDANAAPGQLATKTCAYQNHQLPSSEFDTRAPTVRCNHSPEDCKGCLTVHLAQQLDAGVRWNQVICPRCSENSREVLSLDDIMRFAGANPDVLERFLVQRRQDVGPGPNPAFQPANGAPSTVADSGVFSLAQPE